MSSAVKFTKHNLRHCVAETWRVAPGRSGQANSLAVPVNFHNSGTYGVNVLVAATYTGT